jgi:hypothetical protein
VFNLGTNLAALEVDQGGAPVVVFMQPTGDDLQELLTLPGAVLEKLNPPDDRPVTISRDGRGVVLSVGELAELQSVYKAAIGLLDAYRTWLAEAARRGPVTIPLPRYCLTGQAV